MSAEHKLHIERRKNIMRKKIMLAACVAAMTTAAITGCGKKEEAPAPSVATEAPATEATEMETELETVEEATPSEVSDGGDEVELTEDNMAAFTKVDYTIYKDVEQHEDGSVTMYGQIAVSDELGTAFDGKTLVWYAGGPVYVAFDGEVPEQGSYVKIVSDGAMAMSYPGQISATRYDVIEEAEALRSVEEWNELSACLPEITTSEDGAELVVHVMQNMDGGEYLVNTYAGVKKLQLEDASTEYAPDQILKVVYSGAETRSLPPIMMDVKEVTEVEDSEASAILDAIKEVRTKYATSSTEVASERAVEASESEDVEVEATEAAEGTEAAEAQSVAVETDKAETVEAEAVAE